MSARLRRTDSLGCQAERLVSVKSSGRSEISGDKTERQNYRG